VRTIHKIEVLIGKRQLIYISSQEGLSFGDEFRASMNGWLGDEIYELCSQREGVIPATHIKNAVPRHDGEIHVSALVRVPVGQLRITGSLAVGLEPHLGEIDLNDWLTTPQLSQETADTDTADGRDVPAKAAKAREVWRHGYVSLRFHS
jgi:hypothetical protein